MFPDLITSSSGGFFPEAGAERQGHPDPWERAARPMPPSTEAAAASATVSFSIDLVEPGKRVSAAVTLEQVAGETGNGLDAAGLGGPAHGLLMGDKDRRRVSERYGER